MSGKSILLSKMEKHGFLSKVLVAAALFVCIFAKAEDVSSDPKISLQHSVRVKEALVGKKVKLFCVLPKGTKNRKSFDYKWFKDGKEIPGCKDRYRIKKFSYLKIRSLTLADAGRYKCLVSHGTWNDSITTRLDVIAQKIFSIRPIIDSPEENSTFYASVGESIKVECVAYAKGLVHFQLLRLMVDPAGGGSSTMKVVKKPATFTLYQQRDGASLKKMKSTFHFNNIAEDDFHLYTCMAGNAFGYHTRSFRIAERPSSEKDGKIKQG